MEQKTPLSFNFNSGRRILRGKELEDYIKANPTKDVAMLDANKLAQGQRYVTGYKEGDQGLLGNIGKELIRPFFNVARDIKGDEMLTDTEKDNRTRFRLQNIAGIGANFVPVGKVASIGNIAKAGAIGGGLQALSTSDLNKNIDLGQIAGGALAGGALAGGLGLAGKGIQRLRGKAPTSAPKQALKKVPTTEDPMTELTDKIKDAIIEGRLAVPKDKWQRGRLEGNWLQRTGRNIKLENMIRPARADAAKSIPNFQYNKAAISKLLNVAEMPVTAENISLASEALQKAAGSLARTADIPTPTLTEFRNTVMNELKKQGVGLNKDELMRVADEIIGNSFNVAEDLAKGQGLKPLGADEIYNAMTKTSKERVQLEKIRNRGGSISPAEELKKIASSAVSKAAEKALKPIPNLQQARGVQRAAIEVLPDAGMSLAKTGQVSAEAVMNPWSMITRAITDNTGAALEAAGNIVAGQNPIAGAGALARSVGGMTVGGANSLLPQALSQAGRLSTARPPEPEQIQKSQTELGLTAPQDEMEAQSQSLLALIHAKASQEENPVEAKQRAFAQALQMTNGNVSQAIQLANFMAPAKDSAAEKKAKNELKNASKDLAGLRELIKQNAYVFNPITATAGGFANLADPNRARVETQVRATMQNIATSLEGRPLTDADRRNYEAYLPNISDSVDVVNQKLLGLEEMLKNKASTYGLI